MVFLGFYDYIVEHYYRKKTYLKWKKQKGAPCFSFKCINLTPPFLLQKWRFLSLEPDAYVAFGVLTSSFHCRTVPSSKIWFQPNLSAFYLHLACKQQLELFGVWSEGWFSLLRLRKVWQKRKCSVNKGLLTISHGTVRPLVSLVALLEKLPPSCLHVQPEGSPGSQYQDLLFGLIFIIPFSSSSFYSEVFTWGGKGPIRTEQTEKEEKKEQKKMHKEMDKREQGVKGLDLNPTLIRGVWGGLGHYAAV